jgi:hypothetical protein
MRNAIRADFRLVVPLSQNARYIEMVSGPLGPHHSSAPASSISPAPPAELVPLIVSFAHAVATIRIDVARVISGDAPTAKLVAIAAAATAGSVFAARRPVAAAEADARLSVPAPVLAAPIAVIPVPIAAPVALALVGAALVITLAGVSRELTALDKNVRILSKPKIGPGQGQDGDAGRDGGPQCSPSVAERAEQSRQVVETAIVHVVPGVPSLASSGRADSSAP